MFKHCQSKRRQHQQKGKKHYRLFYDFHIYISSIS
jgi:hypothetical protein